eukprot:4883507-Amphidinium_carterae.2
MRLWKRTLPQTKRKDSKMIQRMGTLLTRRLNHPPLRGSVARMSSSDSNLDGIAVAVHVVVAAVVVAAGACAAAAVALPSYQDVMYHMSLHYPSSQWRLAHRLLNSMRVCTVVNATSSCD